MTERGNMLNIEHWLQSAKEKLQAQFGQRVLFVGLQGSYKRGEATADSDIDLVVILDRLSLEDLKAYRSIVESLPAKDKACGFISGKKELQKWSKTDLFQFFYDTKPLVGSLTDIIGIPLKDDVKKALKTGAENLYHAAVHSFVHSHHYAEDLPNLYKMTFFLLQAKYFVEKDTYIPTKQELLVCLSGKDKEILRICLNKTSIQTLSPNEIEQLYNLLIGWCSGLI